MCYCIYRAPQKVHPKSPIQKMQRDDIKYELKKCFVDRDDLAYTVPTLERHGMIIPARRVEIVKCICGRTLAESQKKKHLLTNRHRNFILSASEPLDTLRNNMRLNDMRAKAAKKRINEYLEDLNANEILDFNELVTRHMEQMRDLDDSDEDE